MCGCLCVCAHACCFFKHRYFISQTLELCSSSPEHITNWDVKKTGNNAKNTTADKSFEKPLPILNLETLFLEPCPQFISVHWHKTRNPVDFHLWLFQCERNTYSKSSYNYSVTCNWDTWFISAIHSVKNKILHTLLKSSLVALISFQVLLSSWIQMQKNSSKARSWVKNIGWKSWQFSLAVDARQTDCHYRGTLNENCCPLMNPASEWQQFIFMVAHKLTNYFALNGCKKVVTYIYNWSKMVTVN